ncbi:hypothetical protein MLD38_018946 [Melastoma candidum]|uniref:Uncharacterized protein n=1 Tax=Melastoma candidum TaxID=119954 RepID=A0ACB9QVZ6_9MYRT|nr:hypothetical protein MLD38_018946 [Melastoma candidum]
MAKQAQIPRFGNWDKDDIPYSVYFDKARKGRSSTGINPNDPEENREASEGKEAAKDGSSSDLDSHSSEDSIRICATTPERLSCPGKQRGNGGASYRLARFDSSLPYIEATPGAPQAGQDESTFNNMDSIKNVDKLSSSERKHPKFSSHGAQNQQHQRRSSASKIRISTDNEVPAYTESQKDKRRSKMNYNPEETCNAFWFPKGSPGNDRDISPKMPSGPNPGNSRWSSLSVHQHSHEISAGYYEEGHTRMRTPVISRTPESRSNMPMRSRTPESRSNTPVRSRAPESRSNTPVRSRTPEYRINTSARSRTPEKETNRTNPQYPPLQDSHHKIITDYRNSTLRSSSTNSSSSRRNMDIRRSNLNEPSCSPYQRSPSAPAFTRWDETSAEGYSNTFNKGKQEKETKSVDNRPAPTVPVIPANNQGNQNHPKEGGLFSCLKASCCLFPDKKE